MSLKGGVIIIGSLLWDNADRKKWRNDNLLTEDKFQVFVPIRYGRLSESRQNTYTMVFSNECDSEKNRGTGWVLPIKRTLDSFNDLQNEAQALSNAEGIGESLCREWGCVALLLNPKKEVDINIRESWSSLMQPKLIQHDIFRKKLQSENSVIDNDGFFTIKWPLEIQLAKKIEEFDFLLGTVTLPFLTSDYQYPSHQMIAEAMVRNNYAEYFDTNIINGISTFQDNKINEMRTKLADKSVVELIFDKFEELAKADVALKGISKELSDVIRKDKRKKEEISAVLKKTS